MFAAGQHAAQLNVPRENNPWREYNTPKRRAAWFAGHDSITNNQQEQPTMTTSTQLFQTADGLYVTRIGTNSKNEAVVEERGTGRVFSVDSSTLKKVIPYTVGIRIGNQTIELLSAPDQVKLGDTLVNVNTGAIAQVTKLNSEAEGTTNELKTFFRRIATEEIK